MTVVATCAIALSLGQPEPPAVAAFAPPVGAPSVIGTDSAVSVRTPTPPAPLVTTYVIGSQMPHSVDHPLAVTPAVSDRVVGRAAAPTPAVSATVAARTAAPAGMLSTSGAQILDSTDAPFVIRAVNWFGLETANCAPHGLWSINLDDGMTRIAGWGFNTLRLPFANQCLDPGAVANSIDPAQNPDLVGLSPIEVMDAMIDSARRHGLKVILDRHRPDTGSQSELWYTPDYSEERWIDDWQMLAERYLGNDTVIGADLHNEPHGQACWGCGDETVDWAAAATRAGNAILTVNPDLLIVVEGIERQGIGGNTWWGGGLADARAHPIELDVPGRLVYSPHDYPASIFAQNWFAHSAYPANLPALWDANWGYLAKDNIVPVLLGEFGSKLATDSDRQWLQTLVGYLQETGISFAYWSFNPNSGDTGGLLADDWITPQPAKLELLAPLLQPVTGAPGSAAPTAAPPDTRADPVTTWAAPSIREIPSRTVPSTPPVPSIASRPSTANSVGSGSSSSRSTATSAALTVTWKLDNAWPAGYVANLQLQTTGGAVDGWSVSWSDPGATAISSAWGMTCELTDGVITCTGADWAAVIPAGGAPTVGLQVAGNGTAPSDPALTVR